MKIRSLVRLCLSIACVAFGTLALADESEFDRLLKEAGDALKLRDYDRAITRANDVLEQETGHHRAMVILGRAYLAKGEFKSADDTFVSDLVHKCPEEEEEMVVALQNQAIAGRIAGIKKTMATEKDPKVLETRWKEVAKLTSRMDADQAIALCTKLIQTYGPDWALLQRASIYRYPKEQYKLATRDYQEYLTHGKDLSKADEIIDFMDGQLSDVEQIQVFSQVLDRFPNQLMALHKRSAAYLRTKDKKHAVDDYRRMFQLTPEDRNLHERLRDAQDHGPLYRARHPDLAAKELARAEAFDQQKDFVQAVGACKAAIRQDPYCYDAYLKRGNLQMTLKDYEGALEAFTEASNFITEDNSMGIVMMSDARKALDSRIELALKTNPQDSAALWDAAKQQVRERDDVKAVTYFELLIKAKPNDPEPLLALGDYLFDRTGAGGDFSKSITLFQHAQALRSDDVKIMARVWKTWHAMGKDGAIIQDCTQRIEKDGLLAEAYCARATAYRNTKQIELALADAEKTLSLDPTFDDARDLCWSIYADRDDWNGMAKTAGAALKYDPQNARWHSLMANAAWRKKDFAEAQRWYGLAIACDPWQGDLYGELGDLCVAIDRVDLAIENYQKQMDCNPRNFKLPLAFGKFLQKNRRFKEAVVVLERAVQPKAFRSTREEALYTLAEIHYAAGDNAASVNAYNRILADDNNDYDRWLRSFPLIAMGKAREVIEDTSERLKASPYEFLYVARGNAYKAVGEDDKSAADYAAALKLAPNQLDALCSLAELRAQQNRYSDAIELYDRALEVSPEDTQVLHDRSYQYLKRYSVNFKAGDLDQALAGWKKCHELQPDALAWKRNCELVEGVIRKNNEKEADRVREIMAAAEKRERQEAEAQAKLRREQWLAATQPTVRPKRRDFFAELAEAIHNLPSGGNSDFQTMVDQNSKAGAALQKNLNDEAQFNQRMHEIERKFSR